MASKACASSRACGAGSTAPPCGPLSGVISAIAPRHHLDHARQLLAHRIKALTRLQIVEVGVLLLPSGILELAGVKVLELDIEEDVDGLCGWINKKTPFIVLKKNNVTVERKRFTALHELAHILFPLLESMDYNKKERMCHRFASAILLPKEVVYTYVGQIRDNLSVSELSSLRTMYGMSVAAIVHRLRDLSVISLDYYNHIFDDRIKYNLLEEGWGAYPLIDKAMKYASLVNRAVIEGYMESNGQEMHIDEKYKIGLGEIEIM
jgi:Zn-dependent peptidase ImmA (M78 family)